MASAESDALTQRALEGAKSVIQKTSPPKRGEVDDASMALLVLIMRNYGRLHMSSADDAEAFVVKILEGCSLPNAECDVVFNKAGTWQMCSLTPLVGGVCRRHACKFGFHTAFAQECVGKEKAADRGPI